MEDQQVEEIESRWPFAVATEDDKPSGCCKLRCLVPDVAVTKHLQGLKFKYKPENGTFSFKINERSLSFTIEGQDKSKERIKYAYKVNKLPEAVDPTASKCKLDGNAVIITLKKVTNKPWTRLLKQTGIDLADNVDDEPPM